MTREESAEIVLQGNPWTRCSQCHGSGNLKHPHAVFMDICEPCSGNGFYMEGHVQYAYEITDTPLLPKPANDLLTKVKERQQEFIEAYGMGPGKFKREYIGKWSDDDD